MVWRLQLEQRLRLRQALEPVSAEAAKADVARSRCLEPWKSRDACADLWGGRVVMGKEELNAKTPVAPVEMTKDLCCPLLGIFGNDDRAPSPEQVNQHEAELKKHGKVHEFYRYDGAGHGIFYWHRPLYRPEQAMDGWSKVFAFFGKHLAK